MYSFLSIIFLLIIGAFCSYNAKLRGRNPMAWLAIGLFLGVIGLLILYLLPPKKPTFESTPSVATPTNAPVAPEIAVEPKPSLVSTAPSPTPQKLWYYLDDENERFGPMSYDRLKQAWIEDQVTKDTFVWNEDMEDWRPVKDLSNLLDQLGDITSPPPSK